MLKFIYDSIKMPLSGAFFMSFPGRSPRGKFVPMPNLGRFSAKEVEFIRDILDEHGDDLTQALIDDIEALELIDSENLLNSVKSKINPPSDLINPRLSIEFYSYGRAIEINWHKSKNAKSFSAPNTNQIVWGMRNKQPNSGKLRKRKNTLWYSRNVYGSLNRLIGKIMYEYQDWVIAKEKAQFKMMNNTPPII